MCDTPRLLTAPEMAQVFHLKEGTFRDLSRRRGWPCFRLGRSVRWDLEEILKVVREQD